MDWRRSILLASLAGAACSPAFAQTAPPEREIYLDPSSSPADWHAGWADARVSGDLVFVSGVVVSPSSDGASSLDQAFNSAFERIERTLLQAGSGLDDVVDLTAYLTDVESQTPALDRVRLKRMRPPFAASTVVQVVRLVPDDAIGEIRVIARARRAAGQ